MLPMTILQPSDFATFATDLNSPNLLPEQAIEPEVAFIDLLSIRTDGLLEADPGAGQLLPGGGNGLPLPAPDPLALLELPVASGGVPGHESGTGVLPGLPPINIRDAGASRLTIAPHRLPTASPAAVLPSALAVATVIPDAPAANTSEQRLAALNALPAAAEVLESNTRTLQRPVTATPSSVSAPLNAAAPEESLPVLPGPDIKAAVDLLKPALRQRHSRTPMTTAGVATDSVTRTTTALAAPELPTEPRAVALPTATAATPLPQAANALTIESSQPAIPQSGGGQTGPSQTMLEGAAPGTQLAARIDVPVRDPAWAAQLGQRLQLLTSNRLQAAEIRLTPAELGPLRVQIALDDGAANVTFHAQHAVTREAIEQALPRLREMLAENGLLLNQADIGEQDVPHGGREGGDEPGTLAGAPGDMGADAEAHEAGPGEHETRKPDGLVDTFA